VRKTILFALPACLAFTVVFADEMAGNDHGLYEQSIRSTKKSIDRDMMDSLYRDAVDAYQNNHTEEALELLDKVYALDPHYEEVAKLRATIRKKASDKEAQAAMGNVLAFMRQGDDAYRMGASVAAINAWKQALAINPAYAPAKKKIDDANQTLARKEFEAGTIHYRHGELEDALDAWSNAIALDPTYKQRGLLLLMSKIQLQVEKGQTTRLATQGFEQYQQGNLDAALQSYQELSRLEPRNEEARRYTAKIKIQLSQTALKAAKDALAKHDYAEAIAQASKCFQYGYDVSGARQVKTEAERQIKLASMPKPKSKPKPKPTVETSTAAVPAPVPAPVACSQDEAMAHYRKGLAAMRTKDYHLALQELDIATQLCASNEHIYIARQRAQQEWSSANPDSAAVGPGAHP
jgi:tetratricopeptide (TPR) repeat protein